jgi:hypothetical protein
MRVSGGYLQRRRRSRLRHPELFLFRAGDLPDGEAAPAPVDSQAQQPVEQVVPGAMLRTSPDPPFFRKHTFTYLFHVEML